MDNEPSSSPHDLPGSLKPGSADAKRDSLKIGLTTIRFVQVPERYRRCALLENALFYLLPPVLLDALSSLSHLEQTEQEMLEMDLNLTRSRKGIPGLVGFNRLQPVYSDLLEPTARNLTLTPDDIELMGWDPGLLNQMNDVVDERLEVQRQVLRARCGWLMTNPAYLADEVEQAEAVSEAGSDGSLPGKHFEFLRKWRLNRLVAPGVPDPPGLLIGPPNAPLFPEHLRSHIVILSIPDYHPLPSQDETRHWIEEAYPTKPPPHEAEWRRITAASNTGKRRLVQIPVLRSGRREASRGFQSGHLRCTRYAQLRFALIRLARLFPLQHHWRTANRRYPEAMEHHRSRIVNAMGELLSISSSSVGQDLREIEARLGPDWARGR